MASPTNERRLKDAQAIVTGTLPNAANTTYSNVVDLGHATPYPLTEQIHVRLENSTATGANSKNINIRMQDSADNSSFANIALLANPALRTTDNAGGGHSASNVILQLPPNTRRYVRAAATGEANGGDSSDGTYTVTLLF